MSNFGLVGSNDYHCLRRWRGRRHWQCRMSDIGLLVLAANAWVMGPFMLFHVPPGTSQPPSPRNLGADHCAVCLHCCRFAFKSVVEVLREHAQHKTSPNGSPK